MTNENNQNRIWLRYLGKKSSNPNKRVFIPINAKPIFGKAPPYSLSTDFPEKMYRNNGMTGGDT